MGKRNSNTLTGGARLLAKLSQQLAAADARLDQLAVEIDRAETAALEREQARQPVVFVTIGPYSPNTPAAVRRAARACKLPVAPYLAELSSRKAALVLWQHKAGTFNLMREQAKLERRRTAIRRTIIRTRVPTPAGIRIKMEIFCRDVRDGAEYFDTRNLALSVAADAVHRLPRGSFLRDKAPELARAARGGAHG